MTDGRRTLTSKQAWIEDMILTALLGVTTLLVGSGGYVWWQYGWP